MVHYEPPTTLNRLSVDAVDTESNHYTKSHRRDQHTLFRANLTVRPYLTTHVFFQGLLDIGNLRWTERSVLTAKSTAVSVLQVSVSLRRGCLPERFCTRMRKHYAECTARPYDLVQHGAGIHYLSGRVIGCFGCAMRFQARPCISATVVADAARPVLGFNGKDARWPNQHMVNVSLHAFQDHPEKKRPAPIQHVERARYSTFTIHAPPAIYPPHQCAWCRSGAVSG